jgi:hypothetical protein
MLKHFLVIVVVCGIAAAALASMATAAKPTPVGISAGFSGYPSCVVQGMNAKFPLTVSNHGIKAETVTVWLSYITSLADADVNSVVITKGTDHLRGVRGAEYWRFKLAPGKSVTKLLVTRIQPPFENKRGPAMYSVSEAVMLASEPQQVQWSSARVPYC